MKHFTKTISFILTVLFIFSLTAPTAVLADEEDNSNTESFNIQNTIDQINNNISNLNSNTAVSVSDYTQLKTAVANGKKNIYITNDIQLEEPLQIGHSVSFHSDSEQKTIYSPSNARHIEITSPDVLLSFEGIILNGNCTNKKETSGGITNPYKNFSISGAVIINCSNSFAPAIDNNPETDWGSFIMCNCSIKDNLNDISVFCSSLQLIVFNCTVENNAGGLSLGPYDEDQNADVYIYNTNIKNNSYYDGGGLNCYWSDVYIDENTVIEGNTADTDGGGIYLWESNLENYASVINNSAQKGAGIYLYKSQVNNYSKICGNTAKYRGGGAALEESKFILESGEISNNNAGMAKNSADYNGGGISILVTSGENDVVINNGTVKNNAAAVGGGISYDYATNYSLKPTLPKIIINNGTVSNNGYTVNDDGTIADITNEGGGIFGCYVEINGGIIEKNIARYGAGIKTQNLTMTGGSIQNNGYYEDEDGVKTLLSYRGGGIYTYGDTVVSGGSIKENQAENGGGLYIVKSLTLTSPASVNSNIASDTGGGIYYYHLVSNNNTDMTCISNNSAVNDGDQYYNF